MKHYITILLLFGSAISQVSAQKYEELILTGDSLFKAKKYDSAFYTYEEAVDLVKKRNVPIPEDDWIKILMGAGNAASARGNYEGAKKYWKLAKGNFGEKIEEKILFLKGFKVTTLFTITTKNFPGSAPYYLQDCTNDTTSYLVWIQDNSLVMQKFDECNSYRPLKFVNKEILKLLKEDLEQMQLEVLENVNNYGNHDPLYTLKFFHSERAVTKTLRANDLKDPVTSNPRDNSVSKDQAIKNYKKNNLTFIAKLLNETNKETNQYDLKLLSPRLRLSIGKL